MKAGPFMIQAPGLRCVPIGMKRGQATMTEEIMAAKTPRLRPEIIFQISFSFERKLRGTPLSPPQETSPILRPKYLMEIA